MYNMARTVEETIQGCSAFSPSHTDFRLRKTAWGMVQETQKLYTITSDSQTSLGARESRDPALSIPSSPTLSYPIWATAWKVNGRSGKKYTHLPSPHVRISKFMVILIRPNVWRIRVYEVRGQERITESCPLEHLVLPLALSVLTGRRIQAKLNRLKVLATCTPLLYLLTNPHCCFSSHRSWVTEL